MVKEPHLWATTAIEMQVHILIFLFASLRFASSEISTSMGPMMSAILPKVWIVEFQIDFLLLSKN